MMRNTYDLAYGMDPNLTDHMLGGHQPRRSAQFENDFALPKIGGNRKITSNIHPDSIVMSGQIGKNRFNPNQPSAMNDSIQSNLGYGKLTPVYKRQGVGAGNFATINHDNKVGTYNPS